MSAGINFADLIVIGLIILSAVFGLMRGFTREVLSVGSWVGAGLAAWYGQPHLSPVVQEQITDPTIADIVAALVIFLGALIALIVLTHLVSSRVRDSRAIGALDRTLGMGFGVGRGILIVVAAWLVIDYLMPDQPPRVVREARSLPYVQATAEYVTSIIPRRISATTRRSADEARETAGQVKDGVDLLRRFQAGREDSTSGTDDSASRDGAAQDGETGKGYTKEQNREKDRFFDSVTERE